MPELPEVESVRRQLEPELRGRTIVDVWWDRHPQQRFSHVDDAVPGHVREVGRRGKYLLATIAPDPDADIDRELVLHLGMTGSFRIRDDGAHPDEDAYARATWRLDDGRTLVFRDPRRFGRVSVVPVGRYDTLPTLARLGPEPLGDSFDPDDLAAGLRATSAPVKAALLNQRLVAGVGNIYADEALWRARIHPASRRVGRERAHALHAAIVEVIAAAIEREGTTFRDYEMVNGASGRNADFLEAYGQAGLPCSRCGTELRKIVLAQRGTTYCPSCQSA